MSAIDYYRRALPLLDGPDRVTSLISLAEVLELVGEWDEADASLNEAHATALRHHDLRSAAEAERRLGVLERKRGRYQDAARRLLAARTAYDSVGDRAGAARSLADLAEVAQFQGDYPTARSRYEESLTLADGITGDERVRRAARALALKGAGTVATWQGDYHSGRRMIAEALEARRELGDRPGVAVLLTNQGVVARHLDQLDEARRLNAESIAMFREIGDRWSLGQLLNNQACVLADQRDFAGARELLDESLRIRRQLGDRAGLALSLNTLADVLIDEGEHAAAVPLLDESLALYRELGNAAAIPYLVRTLLVSPPHPAWPSGHCAWQRSPKRAARR